MAKEKAVPTLVRHSDGTTEAVCPARLFSIDEDSISEAFFNHSPDIYIRRRSRYDTSTSFPDGYCTMEHWHSKKTDVLQIYLPSERFDELKRFAETVTSKSRAILYVVFRTMENTTGFLETDNFEIGLKV